MATDSVVVDASLTASDYVSAAAAVDADAFVCVICFPLMSNMKSKPRNTSNAERAESLARAVRGAPYTSPLAHQHPRGQRRLLEVRPQQLVVADGRRIAQTMSPRVRCQTCRGFPKLPAVPDTPIELLPGIRH